MQEWLEPALTASAMGIMLLAFVSIMYMSWRNGISPMPSSSFVRAVAADAVGRLPAGGRVVEAGSGWGTLAHEIARRCPGRSVIGLENSLIPLWISRLIASHPRVSYIRGDTYQFRYEPGDIVVCYLYTGAMKRLARMADEGKLNGSYLISICFALPGYEPEQVIVCRDVYRTKVYMYRI